MTRKRPGCIHSHRDRVVVGREPSIGSGQQIPVRGRLRVPIVGTRKVLCVSIDVGDRALKALVGHIAASHRRRTNASAFHIEISRIRGTEGAGVRRAYSLKQSTQDGGIVPCRIEHPIRAVLENQSNGGATCRSRTRPATFRRARRGRRKRTHY